ncbi:TetR/AcrR family transcriptional regulator C-terminal domain-containing protein [Nocardia sp. NBC_01499]
MHYTVGFVIEEQARGGAEYENNPYRPEQIETVMDNIRYPLTTTMVDDLFTAEFDYGLRVILAGIAATRTDQAI